MTSAGWRRRLWRWGLVALLIVVLGGGAAGAWVLYRVLATPSSAMRLATVPHGEVAPLQRTAPDGTGYQVVTTFAIVGLDMRAEDVHARRLFPSYGAAVAYARAQGLPTIPSASLILAAGRSFDERLQIAIERQCERGAQGRPALLERWLAAVLARQGASGGAARRAVDRAAGHLAAAIVLGGGRPRVPPDLELPSPPDDPVAGPWAGDAELERVWRRDRYLARALDLSRDADAAAAAVLAWTLAADPFLVDGWARQAAVGRAWYGTPVRATIEQAAAAIAPLAGADPASAPVLAALRALAPADRAPVPIAPEALAWATSPEETVLDAGDPAHWRDPSGSLAAAVADGRLRLDPRPGAGFYRRRWYALETLADPARAPEAGKVQASADYLRHWQRAFAAGFAEGRSSLIKRLPAIVEMLNHGGEPPPVEVAPVFSAEPTPIVYLRLARAYRALQADLAAAVGPEWERMADADGAAVAGQLAERIQVLTGLAALVYQELGSPPPWEPDERGLDHRPAVRAAQDWLADYGSDPAVGSDARTVAGLLVGADRRWRSVAVGGVRLEPVRYRWVNEPFVRGNVKPRFVAGDYWLAAPCPLAVTSDAPITPAGFRARCDRQAEVAGLYADWGAVPPPLITAWTPPWRGLAAVALLLAAAVAAVRLWRRWGRRARRFAGASSLLAVALVAWWIWSAPPYALVRWVFTTVPVLNDRLADGVRHWRTRAWAGVHQRRLFFDLLGDPDPQARYVAAWLNGDFPRQSQPFTVEEMERLRSASRDSVTEVASLAWWLRCRHGEDLARLLAEMQDVGADDAASRLSDLILFHGDAPEVEALAIERLRAGADGPFWRKAFFAMERWWVIPPRAREQVREFLADRRASHRNEAIRLLGSCGDAEDVLYLLPLLLDRKPAVRRRVWEAITRLESDRYRWTQPAPPR